MPRVIATGGTFDKSYDPRNGRLGFDVSCVPEILRQAGIDCAFTPLMLMDSLDMTDAHRDAIVNECRCASEEAIVIVHGTDTMTQTARSLAQAGLRKTIVLTGAMIPALVARSDAPVNLGFAIGAAGLLDAGVWVCMNGQTFRWNEVRKNRQAARFEAT